ncbi:DEKNAAC101963 [Brettanomyces naardenensis]|uniref:DEKNAAC101963 n=1 Tax=Brettanomyces naardenensis TaxID=13370 RepID=A0A448YJF1_BRENA|nr:DEKNAAC101963 [Brettanomyces naardenensis]
MPESGDPRYDDEYCKSVGLFVRLIYYATGACRLPNKRLREAFQCISRYSEYMSIGSWVFAQIPQVIKNYIEKDVEGLSLGFLSSFMVADFLNLSSCFFNDAMLFQILLSFYNCAVDIVLAVQYAYYSRVYQGPKYGISVRHKRKKKERSKKNNGHTSSPRSSLWQNLQNYAEGDTHVVGSNSKPAATSSASSTSAPNPLQTTQISSSIGSSIGLAKAVTTGIVMGLSKVQGMPIAARMLQVAEEKENNSAIYRVIHYLLTLDFEHLAKILGWTSALLYCVSRIPQILTNIRYKSTLGVSLHLILFAWIGNLFYAISLITNEDAIAGGKRAVDFWAIQLCYLVGAVGTVLFDSWVLIQWLYYDILEFCEEEFFDDEDQPLRVHTTHPPPVVNSPSKPIKFSPNVLSPKHIRKLSELTPLTPVDFLLDGYETMAHAPESAIMSPSSTINTSTGHQEQTALNEDHSHSVKDS